MSDDWKKTTVRCGMGIMVLNDSGQVLLGLRNSDAEKASSELNGEGTWTFPGGKFDFGDDLFSGAARELKEETNLDMDIAAADIISISNEKTENAHFFTVGFLAKKWSGELKTMEPEEITQWCWFDFNALPANIYKPTVKFIKNYKDGRLVSAAEHI
ncbi:MAG: NUDIX domain-containing protein [Rickettsiales bacterium]|jgi:8-oxo-dGTP diphosphatase|nr:NUDIX domain-containing protein [Rickettsiales bacterium]